MTLTTNFFVWLLTKIVFFYFALPIPPVRGLQIFQSDSALIFLVVAYQFNPVVCKSCGYTLGQAKIFWATRASMGLDLSKWNSHLQAFALRLWSSLLLRVSIQVSLSGNNSLLPTHFTSIRS